MELAVAQKRPIKSSADRTIDLVHLSRMTFGDRALEGEVLQLFSRQSIQLLAKIENANADATRMLAHTLKGSASGVGAWMVANAAAEVESAVQNPDRLKNAIGDLRAAVDAACELTDDLLRSPLNG